MAEDAAPQLEECEKDVEHAAPTFLELREKREVLDCQFQRDGAPYWPLYPTEAEDVALLVAQQLPYQHLEPVARLYKELGEPKFFEELRDKVEQALKRLNDT